jgi:hypothetical protein
MYIENIFPRSDKEIRRNMPLIADVFDPTKGAFKAFRKS